MGVISRHLRLPRPKTFFHFLSLRTSTELLLLSTLLNKLPSIYGLLSPLTGLQLSPVQLSMYIYSLLALLLFIYLSPAIRSQSPLHCLAIAYLYCLDSVINAFYTAAFGVTWFLVISQHHSNSSGSSAPGAGGSTIDDTAGFTSPEYNVSRVDIISGNPSPGNPTQQEAVAIGVPGSVPTASGPSLTHGVLQSESLSSIITITLLWTIRFYFCLIILSYARFVLRKYIVTSSRSNTALHTGNKSSSELENPFAEHAPTGQGWRGKLGRIMVGVGKQYWLGAEERETWGSLEDGAERFRRKDAVVPVEVPGVVERERRRRSGTGPPPIQVDGGKIRPFLKV